jgi:hypothetical protein
MDSPGDGTPRPRHLALSDCREMTGGLQQAVHSQTYNPDGENDVSVRPADRSLEAFKEKIEGLVKSDKKRKAAVKEKKKAERFAKQRAWNHTIKRVQRYLGIREIHRDRHKASGNTPANSSLGR